LEKQVAKFKEALEFVSSQIKKDASIRNSDFIVSFLEGFDCMYSRKDTQMKDRIISQSSLISFIKTAEFLLEHKMTVDNIFRDAIISQVFHVIRLSIESENTVDQAIYCL